MEHHKSRPGTRREIGRHFSISPLVDVFLTIAFNLNFIYAISQRDLISKYKGAFLGILWMVGTPIALVLAYGFMTIVVFNSRFGSSNAYESLIALWFCITLWQTFAEIVSRSAGIMEDNVALIKRTPFPLYCLSPAVVLTSLTGLFVSYTLGFILHVITLGVPPLSWLAIPIVITPLIITGLALSYLMATIGVFIRDIRYILPLLMTMGMLISPVLYPADVIPQSLRFITDLNPFGHVFEALRSAISGTGLIFTNPLIIVGLASITLLCATFSLFKKFSSEFTDVL